MSTTFSDEGFTSPDLRLTHGAAALDLPTLHLCAAAVSNQLHLPVTLPTLADAAVAPEFAGLAVVKVLPGPGVSVTIDTKVMRWALPGEPARRETFTDYTGAARRGVSLPGAEVGTASLRGELPGATGLDHLPVGRAPMRLADGTRVWCWFAEVPEAAVDGGELYDLPRWAARCVATFERGDAGPVTAVIPAQQLASEREMSEIEALNQRLLVFQNVYLALDETGARVKAETIMLARAIITPPRTVTFGANGPVLVWFTGAGVPANAGAGSAGVEAELPFATCLTTSVSWLDPDAEVSFDDAHFGG